jgi:hypothetical protein
MESLIIAGVLLNIFLSSGVLWKLFDFAKEWGATKQKVEHHDETLKDHGTRLRSVERAM